MFTELKVEKKDAYYVVDMDGKGVIKSKSLLRLARILYNYAKKRAAIKC